MKTARAWPALPMLALLAAGGLCAAPRLVEDDDALLYIPAGAGASRKAPLVVALSPGADAAGMLRTWKGVADRFHWIVLASKRFHNGPGSDAEIMFQELASKIRSTLARYPADPGKVVLTGLSGGAMGAHYL